MEQGFRRARTHPCSTGGDRSFGLSLGVLRGLGAQECGSGQPPPGRSPRARPALRITFPSPCLRASGTGLMLKGIRAAHTSPPHSTERSVCCLGQRCLPSDWLCPVNCCRVHPRPQAPQRTSGKTSGPGKGGAATPARVHRDAHVPRRLFQGQEEGREGGAGMTSERPGAKPRWPAATQRSWPVPCARASRICPSCCRPPGPRAAPAASPAPDLHPTAERPSLNSGPPGSFWGRNHDKVTLNVGNSSFRRYLQAGGPGDRKC